MTGLAQAVMAAANAAAQAAQAAACSGGAGASSGGATGEQGILKRDLAKLIPRPSTFNPTDREQEVLQRRDWYWTVEQYLVVVDCAFQDELEKLEYNLTTEVDWELLDEGGQQRSRFLYSLLGSLVQGRLTGVIKNVEKFNGMEALQQLLMNCQPQARNRTTDLLQGIMSYLVASDPQAGRTLHAVRAPWREVVTRHEVGSSPQGSFWSDEDTFEPDFE